MNNYILDFKLEDDSRIIRATDKLFKLDLLFSNSLDPNYQFNKLTYFIDNNIFTDIYELSYLDFRWGNKVLIGRKM